MNWVAIDRNVRSTDQNIDRQQFDCHCLVPETLNRQFKYNLRMTTSIPPKPPAVVPNRELPSIGPRDDYECRLLELLQEGLDSGPPIELSIPEFIADLRRCLYR